MKNSDGCYKEKIQVKIPMHKIYIIKDNYNNDLKGFNLFLSISLVGRAPNFYSGCLALNSIHHINYIE